MSDREEPTRPDLRFPSGVALPRPVVPRRTPPLPVDAPTPVPPFMGDERELILQALKDLSDQMRAQFREHGARIEALEECAPERCGVEDLRVLVDRLLREGERDREVLREALEETREARRSLQDVRERVAAAEGREVGEERATRRLAPWVRPAATGAGGATVAAAIVGLILRAFGLLPAVEPVTKPPVVELSQSPHSSEPAGE